MMKSITFVVNAKVDGTETICVIGNTEALGKWKPQLATILRKTQHDCDEPDGYIKHKVTIMTEGSQIYYRYFTCHLYGPNDSDSRSQCTNDYKQMFLLTWESFMEPRILNCESDTEYEIHDTFGTKEGLTSIKEGWLTTESEVHLTLQDNAVTMFQQSHGPDNINITAETLQIDDGTASSHPGGHIRFFTEHTLISKQGLISMQGDTVAKYNSGDYLVFKLRTLFPENMAVRFHLKFSSSQDSGFAFLLPYTVEHWCGQVQLPIISKDTNIPLGKLLLSYMVIKPLAENQELITMDSCDHYFYYSQLKKMITIGHRGMGTTYDQHPDTIEARENTLGAFKTAMDKGVDFVEFDVQLSQDKMPIIYHDFFVGIITARKSTAPKKTTNELVPEIPIPRRKSTDFLQIPVQEFSFNQMQNLKLLNNCDVAQRQILAYDNDSEELLPFPLLKDSFERMDPYLGFNVEVKYPLLNKDHTFCQGVSHYWEANFFIDKILSCICKYSGSRRVLLSCFRVDVCVMMVRKQKTIPVVLLCQRSTTADDFAETTITDPTFAIDFAKGHQMLGVCIWSEDLYRNPDLIKKAKDASLTITAWGTENNSWERIQWMQENGIDAILIDRVTEFVTGENVFLIEAKEQQKLLEHMGLAGHVAEDVLKWPAPITHTPKMSATNLAERALSEIDLATLLLKHN